MTRRIALVLANLFLRIASRLYAVAYPCFDEVGAVRAAKVRQVGKLEPMPFDVERN